MLNKRSNTFSKTKSLVVRASLFLVRVLDLMLMMKKESDKMLVTVPTVAIIALKTKVTSGLLFWYGVVQYGVEVEVISSMLHALTVSPIKKRS